MIIRLSHPSRQTEQCVISERDALWLEKQGWTRIQPNYKASELKECIDVAPLATSKRGRPFKNKA